MKKSVISILLIVTVFTSCKNKAKQEDVTNSKETVIEHVDEANVATWMNDIQLDNGAKWEANAETTECVVKMQELLKTETTTTIEDYHQLASKLNEVKNTVVKECTMKGASHDNLHIWLMPLITKIKALSETITVEDAAKIKLSIEENVNGYNSYFQ